MMHNIAAWNIKGAHLDTKLKQVKYIIREHNLFLISLFQTKLDVFLTKRASSYINPS